MTRTSIPRPQRKTKRAPDTFDPYLPPGSFVPLRAVVVRPPDRPVVFVAPPAVETQPEEGPGALMLWDLPPAIDTPGAAEHAETPDAEVYADACAEGDSVGALSAAYDAAPIAPSPSSQRARTPYSDSELDSAKPIRAGGFAQGAGQLTLTILGSTVGFGLGFGMHLIPNEKVAMLGLILMTGGVGGAMLGMMLVNEWVGSMRFQLPTPAQLVVRVFGVLAVACLLSAFAVTTIPREYWPV